MQDTPLLCGELHTMVYYLKAAAAVVFFSILLSSCGSTMHKGKTAARMPGTWQPVPVVIDGESKDWPSPYPNYDAKSMVAYATSNDRQYLYVTMETGDELTQIKILKQGMTLSIDTNGGKDPEFKINYPLQDENNLIEMGVDEYLQKSDGMHSSRQLEQKLRKAVKEANQFSLEGFKNCNGGYFVNQTICGIKVIARIDAYNELVWEAAIPFKAIYNIDSISAAQAGKPISVCFTVKGFKQPGAKNADNASSGMNNGMAGSGMPGGNSGVGRGTQGMGGQKSSQSPTQRLYETTKTWKQFGLAWQ
jgi:hypothetical protein